MIITQRNCFVLLFCDTDFLFHSDDTRRLQEEAFWNSPLDREEQEYEAVTDTFVPSENQAELHRMMIESAQSTLVAIKTKKRPVTINLDGEAIAYFKQLSLETGITSRA